MGTTAATTVVDPSEVNIDAMTYTQSAFGVNFFYLDQILDQMPPISKFIDQTPKDKNLGKLTILPSEVLLLVLETLSIIDLMRFRRCSRSSSQFVDKILQPILKVAPNTIKGLLALRVTTPITARQLFLKLRQRHCNGPECGALAQYMFLPTFARICFRCCACGHGSSSSSVSFSKGKYHPNTTRTWTSSLILVFGCYLQYSRTI
jgi:hypothetical protein